MYMSKLHMVSDYTVVTKIQVPLDTIPIDIPSSILLRSATSVYIVVTRAGG